MWAHQADGIIQGEIRLPLSLVYYPFALRLDTNAQGERMVGTVGESGPFVLVLVVLAASIGGLLSVAAAGPWERVCVIGITLLVARGITVLPVLWAGFELEHAIREALRNAPLDSGGAA